MARFHRLAVADIRRETSDCVSISFDIPKDIKEEFRFIQGQYVTLKLMVNGEELRRSYSICSSPVTEDELRIAVKAVKGGKGSVYINQSLKKGDVLEVMTPMGNFYSPLSPKHKKTYVLFAGGSGITPMLSIIKTVLAFEPGSGLVLFYGNLNEEATIFKNILDQIAQDNPDRFKVYYIFDQPKQKVSDPLYQGILTRDKIEALMNAHLNYNQDWEFFVCGPTPMMDNVKSTLIKRGTENSRIHIEYFTAVAETKTVPQTGGVTVNSKVTVVLYGIETQFNLSTKGKSVLDAALDAGVDVPFACKGAVCCTCRGKILEGTVKMDQNFALTDQEVEEGFILTCQSHPTSEIVKIDYDA
jgi:ring-1,2-phenylacetyl-CoA epoxidase subunit PaaE